MVICCCVSHFPASSSLFMHSISLLYSSSCQVSPKHFANVLTTQLVISVEGEQWCWCLKLFFVFTCSIVSSSSLLSSSICFFLLSKALMSLSNFITFPSFMSISCWRVWKCIQVKILQNVRYCYTHVLCRKKVIGWVTAGLSSFSHR